MTIMSCNQGGDEILTTEGGFEYKWHVHSGEGAPKDGDHAFFQANMYNGDSILHNSRLSPGGREHVQVQEVPEQYAYFRPIMELIKQMGIGDSVSLWYPTDSIPNKPPMFEGIEIVRYDLKMEEVMDSTAYRAYAEAEQAKQMAAAQEVMSREEAVTNLVNETYAKYKAGELEGELQETDSGLKYYIHEKGNSGVTAQPGDVVEAHYYGIVDATGEMFDNSFKRGQTFKFPLNKGAVIAGWDEVFGLLEKGDKATVFIPYTLGYGKAGSPPLIPEEADLIFYVEFVDVAKS